MFEVTPPGAAAMILVGLSLIVVAKGVQAMAKVFKGGSWKQMVATHHKEKGWFGGSSDVSNIAHLIQQLGAAFSLGWSVFSIAGGAAAMLIVGASLGRIAKGVGEFQKAKISTKVADNVSHMVGTLAKAFGKIGKKYGEAGFCGLGSGP